MRQKWDKAETKMWKRLQNCTKWYKMSTKLYNKANKDKIVQYGQNWTIWIQSDNNYEFDTIEKLTDEKK